jgi:hypothetical protein
MQIFLLRIVFFLMVTWAGGEIVVRLFRLAPDIPMRYIDANGIQKYLPDQSGFRNSGNLHWIVNKYGWVGISDTKEDTVISIIGDSYIENMMNPRYCNQGAILKEYFPNIGFFEAGRSGVSFIEALEIAKSLQTEIKPKMNLVYLGNSDILESLANRIRFPDRMQIDLSNNTIAYPKLKSKTLKNILYSNKLLYYLYLRYPIFVDEQNKETGKSLDADLVGEFLFSIEKLFAYCSSEYNTRSIVLVFQPETDQRIIDIAEKNQFEILILTNTHHDNWALGEHDAHWSCYGHKIVAAQVKIYLHRMLYLM